jgi:hypothetical protein
VYVKIPAQLLLSRILLDADINNIVHIKKMKQRISNLHFFFIMAVLHHCENVLIRNSAESWRLVNNFYIEDKNINYIDICLEILRDGYSADNKKVLTDPNLRVKSNYILNSYCKFQIKRGGIYLDKQIIDDLYTINIKAININMN